VRLLGKGSTNNLPTPSISLRPTNCSNFVFMDNGRFGMLGNLLANVSNKGVRSPKGVRDHVLYQG
jgi:hypothetical protein